MDLFEGGSGQDVLHPRFGSGVEHAWRRDITVMENVPRHSDEVAADDRARNGASRTPGAGGGIANEMGPLGLSYIPEPAAASPGLAGGANFRFPTPDDVRGSVGAFRSSPVRTSAEIRGELVEGFEFALTVSPGTVSLAVVNPVRAERSAQRRVEAHIRDMDLLAEELVATGQSTETGGSSREISGWSQRSRSRMIRSFAEHDFSVLFEFGWPAMITLTLPRCWVPVARTGQEFKSHFNALKRRFVRAWGIPLKAAWKLEFQGRAPQSRCQCGVCDGDDDGRAPHLHLFMCPPQGDVDGLLFPRWLSAVWADIVAHPDPVQRLNHAQAGAAVDYRQGLSARDPKRLAVYFSKHGGAGGGKEYQHQVPHLWKGPGAGPGRFWGLVGLERITATAHLSAQDFFRIRRILRRWSRTQVFHGDLATTLRPRTRQVTVERTDTRTGQVRKRTVSRRVQLFRQGALVGGFATVGDGPAVGRALAKALAAAREH